MYRCSSKLRQRINCPGVHSSSEIRGNTNDRRDICCPWFEIGFWPETDGEINLPRYLECNKLIESQSILE